MSTRTGRRSSWAISTTTPTWRPGCSISTRRLWSACISTTRACSPRRWYASWDEESGGFFYTGKSHEALISRTKPAFDGSVPSGNAVAAQALLRLYYYEGNEDYLKKAEKVLRIYYDAMEQQPFGFAHMLAALDFYLEKPREIVLVGREEDAATQDYLNAIDALYLDRKTLALLAPG